MTNPRSLEAAVKAAAEVLNKAVKPVLVGGVKIRWPGKAQDAFLNLAEAGQSFLCYVLNMQFASGITQPLLCMTRLQDGMMHSTRLCHLDGKIPA